MWVTEGGGEVDLTNIMKLLIPDAYEHFQFTSRSTC